MSQARFSQVSGPTTCSRHQPILGKKKGGGGTRPYKVRPAEENEYTRLYSPKSNPSVKGYASPPSLASGSPHHSVARKAGLIGDTALA